MRCTNPLGQPLAGTTTLFLALLPGRLLLLVISRDRGAGSSVLLLGSIGLDLFFYSFFIFKARKLSWRSTLTLPSISVISVSDLLMSLPPVYDSILKDLTQTPPYPRDPPHIHSPSSTFLCSP